MIFSLLRKRKTNKAILERQYAALTATARVPYVYSDFGVPDTVMGRFEMLSVVLILFFRRTASAGTSGQELAQAVVDAFFEDVDHSIRELGVGDTGVPKRMKKFAGMFYGRLESYAAALEVKDIEVLAAALRRNIHPGGDDAPPMTGLAEWMIFAEEKLAATHEDVIATGSVSLPTPGQ